ncbi:hypothetical protein N9Y92_04205 [Chlamydiales bacterium]|nr:hypothetical protein [Chlamydiales bacterium]
MVKKKESMHDICFPVPQNFSLVNKNTSTSINSNEVVKKSLFQQTIKAAFQLSIPYEFTSAYNQEEPYNIITEEQQEAVISLFQAIEPKDAIEAALAQQFIVTHSQAMRTAHKGLDEIGLKKIELTHKILETLQKYRSKGAQQIQVNYNHNEGQINNFRPSKKGDDSVTVEVESV